MDGKTQFEITAKAGAFVAGQRNPGTGRKLWLTEEQAFYPLIAGEIARPVSKTVEKPIPPTPPVSAPKAKASAAKADKEG